MQPMTDTYRLPEEDFGRVAAQTRMKERSLQVAREVLVEGKGLSEVGERHGMKRQQVLAIRNRFFSEYLQSSMFPPKWVRASVCAPQEMLDRFLAEVEQERIKYFSQKGE
ncbi:TrfB-related DNA-binding protein [Burkholderia pseudomallei]|uniref:TrfB-related DNA-binding protein n=1 Tax=Burkholderia pseudomallei TaxID=28450 RepID=UPI000F06A2F0|nr:TrfB-related DNA-binding protein [Burkholderia pseudomallei]CAJ3264820.1 parR [Burkholderia pseudomallei]CAJ3903209.1 parR [Burkholderia pseudomallei]CAJ5187933.1 parR [Burkholderia pseudomallei]CAJ5787840.1 parR [Burkholderia pseudomallei]CAJ6337587.1 parR [Burkholderia pseudomallei]